MPARTSTQGMLRWRATPVLLIAAAAGLGVTGPAPHAAAGTTAARSFTAYVVNSGSNTVTPINTATGAPGRPIPVGEGPLAIAITPNGKTAYVVNSLSDTVTPITTATNTPGRPIPVGGDPADNDPSAIAITPHGKTAYVVNTLGHTVTPITIATNTAGPTIPADLDPSVIAITPNSKTAYVLNLDSVIPIATATNTAGRPVNVGGRPLCDRDHPQREDRVRHRLFRHSDPDRDRYQHPRGTDPGWQHPGRDRDHA